MNRCSQGIVLLASAAGLASAMPAIGQVLPAGNRTIFLERGPGTGSTPMAVAYHPGFDRYYASNGGNATFAAWVYNSAGNRIQDLSALGIDARGWNYNPNTNKLEVNAFNSTANGLWEAGVDGSGNLTGVGTQLLTSLAAAGSQSMMAYNSVADVLYSRESAATVNVIRRSDGTLASSFNLDLASAGVTTSNVAQYCIGYDVDADLVLVVDHTNDRALAFDTTGAFIGASTLDMDVQSLFRMGYANGQIFVFDNARSGWQGYEVIESTPSCYADCDTSTGVGVLDIFDFLCFGNRFAANDPYACDCDTTTGPGVCDIFDFLCFGNEFNAGCP